MTKFLNSPDILKPAGKYKDRKEPGAAYYRYLLIKLNQMLYLYPHSNFILKSNDIFVLKLKILEIANEVNNEMKAELGNKQQSGFILKIFFSHVENPPMTGIYTVDEVNGERSTFTHAYIISMYEQYLKKLESKSIKESDMYDFNTTY